MKANHRKLKMQDLASKGLSITEIGKIYGITKQRVHQILKEKGHFTYVPDTHEIVEKKPIA